VTYLIEYLGEFEFTFETILDHESRDHMGSFDAKKLHRKSHAWAPLSGTKILLVRSRPCSIFSNDLAPYSVSMKDPDPILSSSGTQALFCVSQKDVSPILSHSV
jgi:hypothetical protein